ncbi:MMPL family transporter [Flaviflexus massiliensis]|uniref:MMPL family transporter n=1 Tax=Flaviflexus massiliensis TaxID=1522309 RepID=UPI0006D53BC4|nr:MMPL family transporter [Flaviflexus massiliensis]
MASFLQRLGRGSATHSPFVIGIWALLLVGAILLGTFAGGTYSSELSIPGTRSQDLADRLESELPEAAKGTGTITFTSESSDPLSEEQITAISTALSEAEKVDGIFAVTDPFVSAEEMEKQLAEAESGREQLTAGQEEIDAGLAELESGQEQLDQARGELEAGRAQLDEALAQVPDVPTDQLPADVAAQVQELQAQVTALDEAEAELDSQQAQLDTARAQAEAGQTEIDNGLAQLETAQRTLDIVGDYSVISEDGTAAIATITFDGDGMSVTSETRDGLRAAIDQAGDSGVLIYYSQAIASDISNIFGPTEAIGLLVAAIVLLVMLRAILPATLPILTALVGVGITVMITQALAGVIEMHQISPILGIMLGLAVGIDYTLFVVNRHRRQLLRGYQIDDSIGLAVGTSGNAVVFAGSTVIIALVALNLVGIPFLGVLGNVAALAILIAVLLTITLTPAILHLMEYRVLPKKQRKQAQELDRIVAVHEANDSKPVPLPVRHPWATTIVSLVVLGVLAIPFFSMRLGLPDGSNEDPGSDAYESYMITSEAFGPGRNGPHIVAADLPSGLDEAARQETILQIGEELSATEGIVSVLPAGASEDGDMAVFQVIGTTGPSDVETEDLVHTIRDMSPLTIEGNEITLDVTGQTAMQIDVSENLAEVLPVYLAVVILISLVLLVIVFRSILVPLLATVGFLFSALAAMGSVVAIYQWGWLSDIFGVDNPGPILSFLPIILVGILFGLAMDYQLFLTTGMRESWAHGRPAKKAVTDGLYAGRAVVIAAALIMFSVFAGFIFSEMTMIKPIGFGLAFGILLDAFVVRMSLIPAALSIFGEKAWWIPAWLDKILPSVDVEGASFQQQAEENAVGTDNAGSDGSADQEFEDKADGGSEKKGKHVAP